MSEYLVNYNFNESDQREAAMAAKWAECCDENTSLRQQLDAAQADSKHAWKKAGEACTAHAASIKREAMLRDALHFAHEELRGWYEETTGDDYNSLNINEALAATADLDGLILCEKKPVGTVLRSGRTSAGNPWHNVCFNEDGSINIPQGTPLYRAREPKP